MTQASAHDQFLDQIVATICRYGLRLPVLITLEAGRPVTYLGGQLLWVMQPALSLLFSRQSIQQMAQILEEQTAVDDLITRLEAKED